MRMILLTACLLCVAGCDMMVAPWQLSDLRHKARQPVTCETGKDCDEKWARALQWVKRKSKLPIATQSGSLIKTAPSANLNSDPAFTITKAAAGDTTYRIDFAADCDDGFGCTPPILKLKASFVEFVTGTSQKIQ